MNSGQNDFQKHKCKTCLMQDWWHWRILIEETWSESHSQQHQRHQCSDLTSPTHSAQCQCSNHTSVIIKYKCKSKAIKKIMNAVPSDQYLATLFESQLTLISLLMILKGILLIFNRSDGLFIFTESVWRYRVCYLIDPVIIRFPLLLCSQLSFRSLPLTSALIHISSTIAFFNIFMVPLLFCKRPVYDFLKFNWLFKVSSSEMCCGAASGNTSIV